MVGVVVFALSGCATLPASRADDWTSPSASVGERLQRLTGRWQGVISETEGVYWQGSTPLDITLKPDGTWQGTMGDTTASGTVQFRGGGQIVLRGTRRSSSGYEEPVYLRLSGDDTRRWGETRGRFSGRDERAAVSLRRRA
jgi:hypothetical protein